MANVLKGHKTVGRLNSNERVHLYEMTESKVSPRQMLTNLRKRNKNTSTTIKHIYNATHRYIKAIRDDMQHISLSRWLRMSMCTIVVIIMILMMSVIYFGRIQMVSSCLTHSIRCLCWIPHIRRTSIVFCCLSLSVTLLPS